MSGVGGGSGGGGGSGSSGVGDEVAQELADVRAKIEKLEKAIEVQQEKLEDAEGNDERWGLIATALAAKEQRLVELQKKENRLAEQQQQQQQQTGERLVPIPSHSPCVSSLGAMLPGCSFALGARVWRREFGLERNDVRLRRCVVGAVGGRLEVRYGWLAYLCAVRLCCFVSLLTVHRLRGSPLTQVHWPGLWRG